MVWFCGGKKVFFALALASLGSPEKKKLDPKSLVNHGVNPKPMQAYVSLCKPITLVWVSNLCVRVCNPSVGGFFLGKKKGFFALVLASLG